MRGHAAGLPQPPAKRRGLRRGSLTPELIVAESVRLLDDGGTAGFSLPRLGRALGADPTAVYRHFASKDDLILAIADHLIQEAMAGLSPRDCWLDTVIETMVRLRQTYRSHPAAASLAASRTPLRKAELKTVDVLIGAVLDAGFEGAEAVRIYRALGRFALSWSRGEAAVLALDARLQENDRTAWARAYRAVDRGEYPHIWQVREDLPGAGADDTFDAVLSLIVAGLIQRAPRRCRCPGHTPSRMAAALLPRRGESAAARWGLWGLTASAAGRRRGTTQRRTW